MATPRPGELARIVFSSDVKLSVDMMDEHLMRDKLNEGTVGDTAKLMMHRLIVRKLRRDPSLKQKAKDTHAHQEDQFKGWSFVTEWDELLALPLEELAVKLIIRNRVMVRLRNSSPFYLAEGVHFGGYFRRGRLRRAARRLVARSASTERLVLTTRSETNTPEIVTVPERKAREAQRRRVAAQAVMTEAKTFASTKGGRFYVFGSVAEDRVRFDSDFDVIVDFPQAVEMEAFDFIEDACRRHQLPPDIHLKSWASEGFLGRIRGRATVTLS